MKITEFKRVGYSTVVSFDNGQQLIIADRHPFPTTIDEAFKIASKMAVQMQQLCILFGIGNREEITLKELLTYCEWLAKTGEEI